MRQCQRFLIGAALAVLIWPGSAWAKPGPIVSGFLERFEYHSKTANSNSTEYGNDFYLYSMLFIARELDTGITGTMSYIHQYGIHDSQTLANIGNLSLSQKVNPGWRLIYSYSHLERSGRNASARVDSNCIGDSSGAAFNCPGANADWLGLAGEYNSNPAGARKNTFKAAMSYNTTTDFGDSSSLAPKISFRRKLSPRYEWEPAYQMIYNLSDEGDSGNEISAHQLFMTLDINSSSLDKVQLQYIFSDNVYDGNPGDDNILRLSYLHLFKIKK